MINARCFNYYRVLIPLVGFTLLCGKEPNPKQPIEYSHQFHIDEVGLTCTDCHVQVETHRQASIPNVEICSDCHEDLDSDIAEAQKVSDYISNGTSIPWIQIHRVPDYVYFSHRRHVSIANLECQECHGDVAQKTTPFVRPYKKITMNWCLDCHKTNQVSLDCYTCHR